MTSVVDWLRSKFGTNFAQKSKFHIRMTILCQLRDSVTPAFIDSAIPILPKSEILSLVGIPEDRFSQDKALIM